MEKNLFPIISVFILLSADFLCIFLEQIHSTSSMEKCVKQMLTIFATL